MENFIKVFSKLKSDTKTRLIIILLGLLTPSIIYLTLNHPGIMYNSDFFKIIIMGTAINITCIFIMTFFTVSIKVISGLYYDKYIRKFSEILDFEFEFYDQTCKNKDKNLNAGDKTINIESIEKTQDISNTQIDANILCFLDISKMKRQDKILNNHYYRLINLFSDISSVSFQYLFIAIIISIFNLSDGNVAEFNSFSLFMELRIYIGIMIIIDMIMNFFEIRFRIKDIVKTFSK